MVGTWGDTVLEVRILLSCVLKLLEWTLVNRTYQLTRTLLYPARAEMVESRSSTVEDGGQERLWSVCCCCCCCCFSHSAYWLPARKKIRYTVANPARGLMNREKRTKEKALRRSWSVSRPYKDTFGSSTRPMGVASQNSTLPSAIISFPVSLLLSSPGDI